MPMGQKKTTTNVPESHKLKLFPGRRCTMHPIFFGSAVESMGSVRSYAECKASCHG